jgi:hypothetical protein
MVADYIVVYMWHTYIHTYTTLPSSSDLQMGSQTMEGMLRGSYI